MPKIYILAEISNIMQNMLKIYIFVQNHENIPKSYIFVKILKKCAVLYIFIHMVLELGCLTFCWIWVKLNILQLSQQNSKKAAKWSILRKFDEMWGIPIQHWSHNNRTEHHILAQNLTSNMSNITKNRTVREHRTVRSKTT